MDVVKESYQANSESKGPPATAEVHLGTEELRLKMPSFSMKDRKGAFRVCKGADCTVRYPKDTTKGTPDGKPANAFRAVFYLETNGRVSARIHTAGNHPMPPNLVEKLLQVNLEGDKVTILHAHWLTVTSTKPKPGAVKAVGAPATKPKKDADEFGAASQQVG